MRGRIREKYFLQFIILVELGSKGIEASWAGGHLGLNLTR